MEMNGDNGEVNGNGQKRGVGNGNARKYGGKNGVENVRKYDVGRGTDAEHGHGKDALQSFWHHLGAKWIYVFYHQKIHLI